MNSHRKFSDELIFLPLRDSSGTIQLVLKGSSNNASSAAARQSLQDLTAESVIWVEGKVVAREANTINRQMATGEIEIELSSIRILNKTHKPLPFLPTNQELVRHFGHLDMQTGIDNLNDKNIRSSILTLKPDGSTISYR